MYFDNTTTDSLKKLWRWIVRFIQRVNENPDVPWTFISLNTEFCGVDGVYRQLVVWVPGYLPSEHQATLKIEAELEAGRNDLRSGTHVVMHSLQGFWPEALWWFRLVPTMPEYIIKVRNTAQERTL